MCLSTFVKYNVIENHTAWSKGAKSTAAMRSDIISQAWMSQLLESNHQNIPGSTKMLWLNIRNKGCAQEAPLLFWVGFLWRKWNVIVIRSPGWRCLFYSLGCCNAQEAVGWREMREAPSHRIPWGLTGDGGMTGAEETEEVLCQIGPVELESWPAGQGSPEGTFYHSQKSQWYIVPGKIQTRQLQERAGSHFCLPIRFSIFNHHFLSTGGWWIMQHPQGCPGRCVSNNGFLHH